MRKPYITLIHKTLATKLGNLVAYHEEFVLRKIYLRSGEKLNQMIIFKPPENFAGNAWKFGNYRRYRLFKNSEWCHLHSY